MTGSTSHANSRTVTVGALFLAGGLGINYLLERYNIFKVWENSRYPISWADLFYPPLCVFLSLTGVVLGIGGAIYRLPIRRLLRRAFAIVIPLTVLYTLFAFAMQFIQTGADRLGECQGLQQAAVSSNVIPESGWRPHQPAIGCGLERRGIFLSYYNEISIAGVGDAVAQQLVLDRITEQHRQARTHPVQVMFYEQGNWTVRQVKPGVTLGSGGPGKLLRVVSIG